MASAIVPELVAQICLGEAAAEMLADVRWRERMTPAWSRFIGSRAEAEEAGVEERDAGRRELEGREAPEARAAEEAGNTSGREEEEEEATVAPAVDRRGEDTGKPTAVAPPKLRRCSCSCEPSVRIGAEVAEAAAAGACAGAAVAAGPAVVEVVVAVAVVVATEPEDEGRYMGTATRRLAAVCTPGMRRGTGAGVGALATREGAMAAGAAAAGAGGYWKGTNATVLLPLLPLVAVVFVAGANTAAVALTDGTTMVVDVGMDVGVAAVGPRGGAGTVAVVVAMVVATLPSRRDRE